MRIFFLIVFQIIIFQVFAQQKITGFVFEQATKKPLHGVSIKNMNSETGTATNQDGSFQLQIPQTDKLKLHFSHVGFRDTVLNITIKENSEPILCYLVLKVTETPTVFVTANRNDQDPEIIPARIAIIKKEQIEAFPVLNADDLFMLIPGISIDRNQGIFSKNSSITMRGLTGSLRSLIMLDNIPIVKADGGGVNWNRIIPENVEKVEIVKGPVSALYGGNAMGGAVNIITRRPVKELEGDIKAFYGSFNTMGANANLSGKMKNNFYWSAYNYYKQGDGYIITPDSTRSIFDDKTYLWEMNSALRAGYQISEKSYIEAEYTYYDDKRGDGTKVAEPDGGFNKYTTHSARISLNYEAEKYKVFVNTFFQYENYQRQAETVAKKKNNKYTLYNTDADRFDQGLWCNIVKPLNETINLSFGTDVRRGAANASDIYYTSSDILTNKGIMDFYALFANYEQVLFKKKLRINAGLRFDYVSFHNGAFIVEDPSTLSAFMENYPTPFTNESWNAFTPKLALKYFIDSAWNVYASAARGFRAPMLDDMCKNGNITRGFKVANPQLKPELLDNFELGVNYSLSRKFTAEATVFYSIGRGFQYFVGTGDSVYTGGDNLKPLLKRQNVARAEIIGTETSVKYNYNKNLYFIAGYSYCRSLIAEFDTAISPGAVDITGKFISQTPEHLFNTGVFWKNKIVDLGFTFFYTGKQWYDDNNIQLIPAYYSTDIKFVKTLKEKYQAALTIQNIFNEKHFDNKGNLSPGRFFMLSFSYKL